MNVFRVYFLILPFSAATLAANIFVNLTCGVGDKSYNFSQYNYDSDFIVKVVDD